MGRSLSFSSLQNKGKQSYSEGLDQDSKRQAASVVAASPGMGESEEEMLVNALLAFEATH